MTQNETLDLPPFRPVLDDGGVAALQALPTLEPISRPSSTSSQLSLPQLPGISSLAVGSPSVGSPQLRATNIAQPVYAGQSPAATTGGAGVSLPTCQNCSTSTTPLWRRDEHGSVLCNACGLFLKLHGRPRPISLKTDVIKSRNRVKTIRPEITIKKKQGIPLATESNGAEFSTLNNHPIAIAASGARRASQKSTNGHSDVSHSPISRTATPSMYPHLPGFHGMEEAAAQYAQSAATAAGVLPPHAFNVTSGSSPGRPGSPLNGERGVSGPGGGPQQQHHLDVPQTQEQLAAANSGLKTRVSELEVINDLYQSRLAQLEQDQTSARRALDLSTEAESQIRTQLDAMSKGESQLRAQLEDSHRRENALKRKLDDLEVELKETKDALEMHENGRNKKLRVSDMVAESDASTPQSAA